MTYYDLALVAENNLFSQSWDHAVLYSNTSITCVHGIAVVIENINVCFFKKTIQQNQGFLREQQTNEVTHVP